MWAASVVIALVGLAVMPTVTAAWGHDSDCARGCDGACEPGCLSCACLERAVLGEAASPFRSAVGREVSPVPIHVREALAVRAPLPLLRPPRV